MTGDMGRPQFLPPEEQPPEPVPDPGPEPAAEQPSPVAARSRAAAVWSALTVLSSLALLISAFLPWARLEMVTELLGASIRDDLGPVAGIEADGTVVVVPVLALSAAVVALWGAAGRDARIAALAALPGSLALVACVLFALRLHRTGDRYGEQGALIASHTHVSLAYGWYLAVGAALLVVGTGLVRPFARRARARTADGPAGGPDQAVVGPDQS
ncbi:hypothetical protein [Actinomadura oligospora]|uniref:hypothetical protein n=1 Tax=Actinomadura oligospora TaxID=111804 RepID=UPI000478D44F|nr:hypothetical protein [Actinomadura oligospora]